VVRNLVEGLAWQSGWQRRWQVPTKSAIFQARARLGPAVMEALFARVCLPLATQKTPGAFYGRWRLVSLDGTTLDVADTAENVAAFGRPGSGRGEGEGGFPQLRVVALAECGTHALFGAALDAQTTAESTLARGLVSRVHRGMLVLADRGFTGHPLFSAFAASGADLLWRAKENAVLPVLERLADGSYRSELVAATDKRARQDVMGVRVVEYALDPAPSGARERYRLLTTIADPRRAPAHELAALYPQRWEFETTLDELKTHERGPRVVLRSKTPDGVRQEAWGYLCTHYAIRALMAHVANDNGVDPDRISFTRSLRASRRSVRAGVGTSTKAVRAALHAAVVEIGHELVPERRLRLAARVVKRKMSNYTVKRSHHRGGLTMQPPAVTVIGAPA
jgi:Transposase DDE domain/Insertion element 4 transposase N-terminal